MHALTPSATLMKNTDTDRNLAREFVRCAMDMRPDGIHTEYCASHWGPVLTGGETTLLARVVMSLIAAMEVAVEHLVRSSTEAPLSPVRIACLPLLRAV